jgi:hypothetical protein
MGVMEQGGADIFGLAKESTLLEIKDALAGGINPADYPFHNLDKTTTTSVLYIGKLKQDGTWLVQKFDKTSTENPMTYANLSNNATRLTYALAWANRATLTYGLLSTLT